MTVPITTADIAAFAARRLASLRHTAHQQLERAQRLTGSAEALQCAYAVGQLLDQSHDARLLAQLAGEHGDSYTEIAIEADLESTQATLISRAQQCRLASIAREAA